MTRTLHTLRAPRAGMAVVGLVTAFIALAGREAVPATQYRVVPDASELRVLVWRAGPLAGLGHNHVVVTHALSGGISLASATDESTVRLEFPVASLRVDDAEARRAQGPAFEGSVPPDDIAATTKNMLGPDLLDAQGHPTIRIESTAVEGGLPNVVLRVRATVKGRQYPLEVPVSVNTFDGGLVAVGRLRIGHADLGLEPFTVALGSLRVAEALQVSFRIVARTKGDAPP